LYKGGMQQSFEALAQIALEVAREASELVREGWRKRPAAAEKTRANLVTEYDLASERLIRARLAERAPDLAVVAEEQGGRAGAGLTFYCDPLDGTTNFVHGHPFWCVSIGVLQAGVPVAGAVVAPCLATEWVGWQGGVPLRNSEACVVSDTRELGEALVATGFPTDRSRAPDNNFDTFVQVKKNVRAVRRCGAAAIDMCFVADGTYDGYWERIVNAWDVAAGGAVLLAAGGKLTALDGSPARLERGHILATNGYIHADLSRLVS
jgi:myo-inositol-1(or 4)-monophosphatase